MSDNSIPRPPTPGGIGNLDCVNFTFGGNPVLMTRKTLERDHPESLMLQCKESGMSLTDKVRTPTFDSLPDEMMQNIFMVVDRDDLVQTCRLVSKRWKDLSTVVCRRRFVKLDRWEHLEVEKILEFFTVFRKCSLPPWSSYQIFRHDSISDILRFEFFQIFGKHIWELTLNESDQVRALGALSRTPNLRKLYLDVQNPDWTPMILPGKGGLRLDKLKQLTISGLCDSNVELLNYLITRCGVRLDYFKTSLKVRKRQSVEMVASLLDRVPYIALKNIYCQPPLVFKVLTSALGKLCIKELLLDLGEFDVGEDQVPRTNFDTVEQFIELQAQYLKKLELWVSVTASGSHLSVPFHFPSLLPSLTSFRIYFRNHQVTHTNFGNGFLSLIKPTQFPVLEKVDVQDSSNMCAGYPEAHVYFPLNCHFQSVTKLTLGCSARDDWNGIFPNLTWLAYFCNDSDVVMNCFFSIKLEHLNLYLFPQNGTNINSLLSGIPDPDAIYGRSEDEISRVRGASILQLTKLKSLYIVVNSGSPGGTRSDAGAGLSLLQIEPLDLSIGISEVSEECEAKLEAHHRTFTRIP